jgi:CRP/FNR family cyclic AMP-dependent transcriptional regulator
MLRKDAKVELLKGVTLFSRCSKKQLAAIARRADLVDLPAGTSVIREGAPGREFMVIVEGAAEVSRKGRKLNTIGSGDFTGEIALITGSPRTATVTTTSDTWVLAFTAHEFRELLEPVPGMQASVIEALGERLQALTV